MVRKLFKHEFIAYIRALLPMYVVLLGIAALTRFVVFFESDSAVYNIVIWSSIIALVIASIVCLVLSFLNVVTRYYKNMFTHEGYLTLTLPVTSAQHIWVKVTAGVVSILAGFVMIVLAVCVATAGELNIELFKALFYLLNDAQDLFEGHFIPYLIEIMILFLVALFSGTLLFYACISIGQLSNKNRIAAAIGVFFAYYFVTQILSTVFMIVLQMIRGNLYFIQFLDSVREFLSLDLFWSLHLFWWFAIIFTALLGLLYFSVSHFILKKKLNLE
ncbi:MAG: hypothetical protein E7574_05045 [Ruminococcaceae bacterium]|nr:hypothetical protein [Oscillospiraceae bacterium]